MIDSTALFNDSIVSPSFGSRVPCMGVRANRLEATPGMAGGCFPVKVVPSLVAMAEDQKSQSAVLDWQWCERERLVIAVAALGTTTQPR